MKNFCFALAALLAATASCTKPTPAPAAPSSTTVAATAVDAAPTVVAPDAAEMDPDDPENPRVKAANALLETEAFGTLKPGISSKDVVALLGQPSSKGKAEGEGATGDFVAEWVWKKAGVTIFFASGTAKGPWVARNVSLAAPATLKTHKGIGIGSTLADVDKAYAAGHMLPADGEESYTVGTHYDGMVFEFKDGKVSSIYWGMLAF
ncbi:MAG TPA: hypothetical protein PLF40_02825 [Kofleriaceae bacterium]|nr:hypothetical protein [Kofleriaceae bacterium]